LVLGNTPGKAARREAAQARGGENKGTARGKRSDKKHNTARRTRYTRSMHAHRYTGEKKKKEEEE
jgi:hypothetical protein